MSTDTATIEIDLSESNDKRSIGNHVNDDAIAAEIRIVQSVQTQNNMPVLLLGNSAAAGIVAYIDWSVLVNSYAVYFLAALLLLLVPVLRSYLKLRHQPRPTQVSKRRIRTIVIHSFLLSLAWAGALYLMISNLNPNSGILVLYLMFFVGFGAAALMPSLPLAAIVYLVPMSLATILAAILNDILRADLIFLIAIGGYSTILISVWKSWQDSRTSVRLSLEKLQAEAEIHQRETEAMRSMLAAVPFPLIMTRESGAVEASETAARQFGIPPGAVGGLQIVDFFVDPVEQEKLATLQAEQGRLDECEVHLRNAQGQPFWALLSSLPLKYEGEDCWLNAIVVIDDRKKAEAELLSAHQILETVSGQLAKYISPQLYTSIFSGEQKVAIDSKRKKLTIFFSDIANFTEITDQLESEELTSLLNLYLTEMSKIAEAHGAYFDKFIGDAMMFYFGDPETKGVKEDASACVRMAIAMQRRLRQLEIAWREQGLIDRPFKSRIGINTGYCTVGNFGNEDRMDYTIIGGEVNLAARLEANADIGGILITAKTYSLVKDWLPAEEREPIDMKGFAKPIKTFSVIGIHDQVAAKSAVIRHDEEGIIITIDSNSADKSKAILALKNALAQLEG